MLSTSSGLSGALGYRGGCARRAVVHDHLVGGRADRLHGQPVEQPVFVLWAEHRAVELRGEQAVNSAERLHRGGLSGWWRRCAAIFSEVRDIPSGKASRPSWKPLVIGGGFVGLVGAVEQLGGEAGRAFGVGLLLVEFGAVGGELRDAILQGVEFGEALGFDGFGSRRSISAASSSS